MRDCAQLTPWHALEHGVQVNRRSVSAWRGLFIAGVLGLSGWAHAAPRSAATSAGPSLPTRDLAPLGSTSWLVGDAEQSYRLPTWSSAPLLERFVDPSVERRHPADEYWFGRFGQRAIKSELRLVWLDAADERDLDADFELQLPRSFRGVYPETDYDELPAWLSAGSELGPNRSSSWLGAHQFLGSGRRAWQGRDVFPTWAMNAPPAPFAPFASAPLRSPCPAWVAAPRPVTVGRYGAEQDRFVLLECDGSVAPEALDRLSVMARPPGAERPELPLPLEPDAAARERGEWVKGVKLLHPRLLWLVNKLALAFPGHPIYLISGYRRDAHGSYHRSGRALDLFMTGVPNEALFKYCRKLKDVGCGYYPNHNFVHVDVRGFGQGHPFWIDVSGAGEPSRYVDSWPGVADSGGLIWAGGG